MSKYDKYKESAFTHEEMQPMIVETDMADMTDIVERLLNPANVFYEYAADEAADEIERLREALTIALSALVAATSLLKRSEDEKVKPSRAVASNKIFRLMMADYERAEDNARAALLGEKE